MAKRCYYETLSIERTASDGEIKTAFRKHAMQFHPDRNPGDKTAEHRFKEINEAYEVLKDPDKRAAYDRFGHAAFEHGMGGGPAGFGADFGTTFSDLFEGIFGMSAGRGRSSGRERGADLRYNMEITLQEAFGGKAAQIRIPTSVTCEACSGSGAKPGPNRRPVRCAAATAGCATPRAFSPSNALARIAMAAASRSTRHARHAPAPAASPANARCR